MMKKLSKVMSIVLCMLVVFANIQVSSKAVQAEISEEQNSGSELNGVYKIKNVATGLYLDVTDGGTTAGTAIQQWSSTPTDINRNQLFKITFLGELGGRTYYSIRSMTNSSMALSSLYSNENAPLTIEDISVTEDIMEIPFRQAWTVSQSGSYYTLMNGMLDTGNYITAPTSTANGSAVITTTTATNNYSKWVLEPYTGSVIRGAVPVNFKSKLVVGESYYFYISLYSSIIGQNGSVEYQVLSTDGTTTDKATVNSETGYFTALKPGEVQLRAKIRGSTVYWSWNIEIRYSSSEKYYIQNKGSKMCLHASADESGVIRQYPISSVYDRVWEIIWVDSSYFKIKDTATNLYVTTSSDTSVGTLIIEDTESDSDHQLWKFTLTSSGAYKIQAKSKESTSLVLSCSDGASARSVSQNNYVRDTNYFDEWIIYQADGTDVMLLGVYDSGHDHTSSLISIKDDMWELGYEGFNMKVGLHFSESSVVQNLEKCKVFVSRSHGNVLANDEGTYISVSSYYNTKVTSSSLYDFSTNTPVADLNGCDLIIFVACLTANHPTKSLPQAAVLAGADCAIGFTESIGCNTSNVWTEKFFEYYRQGYSAQYSAQNAANYLSNSNGIGSFVVYE